MVDYQGAKSGHKFRRYPRDRKWEEAQVSFLKELGLKSRDDIHFHLEGDFHDAISFMNEYGKALQEEGLSLLQQKLDKAVKGITSVEIFIIAIAFQT